MKVLCSDDRSTERSPVKTSMPRIASFSEVSGLRGFGDLFLHWGAIAAIFLIAHRLNHWLGYVSGVVLISGLQHGLINLGHDAWHSLCLKPARLNGLIGAWLYGYVVGIPFFHDRKRHFQHHRRIGFDDDPDRVNYRNDGRAPFSRFLLFLLGKAVGGQLWQMLLALARRGQALIPLEGRPSKPTLLSEYAAAALCQFILLAAFAWSGRWWEYFVLWFLPLVTLVPVWVGVRAFVEHSSHHDHAKAPDRLHDFLPSFIEAFFISPCHFNYHALHHSYPTVPHYRLKELKRVLLQTQTDYVHNDQAGYLAYLITYFADKPQQTKQAAHGTAGI